MFFWQNVPDVDNYSLKIDGAKPIIVKPGAGSISHVAATSPLSPGIHTWTVIAMLHNGKAIKALASPTWHLTVKPGHAWPAWAIGPFERYAGNPLITPKGNSWQSRDTYNPGVIFEDGQFRMLYRGQNTHKKSEVGYAHSNDGINFIRSDNPVIADTQPFETAYGCEDARFYHLNNTYFTFYTGNTPHTRQISLCEATSNDGTHWTKLGVIQRGTKNGALLCGPHGVPVKIGGKYVMYTGNGKVGICYSNDLLHWGPIHWINLHLPANWVRPYEPCFAVTNISNRPNDIVLFIAGTLNGKGKWYYAISETLLKKTAPEKIADRLDDCIFKPKEPYESGEYKKCLWMNSILKHNNQWWMYYGAGDRNVALANAPV